MHNPIERKTEGLRREVKKQRMMEGEAERWKRKKAEWGGGAGQIKGKSFEVGEKAPLEMERRWYRWRDV